MVGGSFPGVPRTTLVSSIAAVGCWVFVWRPGKGVLSGGAGQALRSIRKY